MIVALPYHQSYRLEPILTEVGEGEDAYTETTQGTAIRFGEQWVVYRQQISKIEQAEVLSVGGFIFETEADYKQWLNNA